MNVKSTPSLIRLFERSNYRTCFCCVLNARSVVNKICELQQLLYNTSYDIVLVTETWLHDGISSGALDPRSVYNIIRKDREGSHHGGGVAVFVKRSLCIAEVAIDDLYTNLELLCFDVFIEQCSLRFFVVYRPPHTILKPLITWIC